MTQNSKTGAAFIAGGSIVGAGVSATVGGMGLAGGFGAVGIGTTPVVGAGAVVGAAAYGAFKAIAEGDAAAFGAMGIGAAGGAGVYSVVGGMGLVAPKVGLAFGIGAVPMAGVGAVVGLAAYGIAKLLDESEFRETPAQLFERMEEKVLQMDYYSAAVMELEAFLCGEDLNQKFAALEVEDELQALKAQLKKESEFVIPKPSTGNIESKTITVTSQLSETWRCVRTLKGHLAAVNAIAITPDGTTLVSGSDDRQVNLWNLKTGKWLIAISPDGTTLASGSADKTIRLWDLKTWQQGCIFTEHVAAVNTVAIDLNSQTLISGSTDTTIKLWNLYTGELLSTLVGHSTAVLSVAINSDGKTLASASKDGIIKLWNLHTGKLLQTLSGCNPVAFSPDGKTLVSGGNGGSIKVWSQIQCFNNLILDPVASGEWWEILGVNQSDDANVVKFAYRRLARLYHPDINTSASAKASIQAINQAYKEFQKQLSAQNYSKIQNSDS